MKDHNIDILAMTETWLRQSDEDNMVVGDITVDGFFPSNILPELEKKVWLHWLIIQEEIICEMHTYKMRSFECMDACVTAGGTSL